jgi:ADP-heptose:LPS heptosyltransferase
MKILKLKVPLILLNENESSFRLSNDKEYIVSDYILMEIRNYGLIEKVEYYGDFYEHSEIRKREYKGQNLYGKKIVTFRNGGIGDIIFQLPSLKHIKDLYQDNVDITMFCNSSYIPLFEPLDYLTALPLPLTMEDILKYDYWVNFENSIERNTEAEEVNAYELYARKFFITPTSYVPILQTLKEKDDRIDAIVNLNKKNIVIAFFASAEIRTIDPNIYANVIANLPEDEYDFYIVGTKKHSDNIEIFVKEIESQAGGRKNVINWAKDYNDDIALTASLIKKCDLIIGPDSGLIHVAAGFETPIIGLFGAFHSSLRIKYYKKAIGIDTETDCYFARGKYQCCFQHGGGSCSAARKQGIIFPPCMESITPNDILKSMEILKIYEKK